MPHPHVGVAHRPAGPAFDEEVEPGPDPTAIGAAGTVAASLGAPAPPDVPLRHPHLFLSPEAVSAKDAGGDTALRIVARARVVPAVARVRVVARGVERLPARWRPTAARAPWLNHGLSEPHTASEPEPPVAQGELRGRGGGGEPRRCPRACARAKPSCARAGRARKEPRLTGLRPSVGEMALPFKDGLRLGVLPGPVALCHRLPQEDAVGLELSCGSAR